MGGAGSTSVSAPLTSTTHPRMRTLGATPIVPGERLPAPYTLKTTEQALQAGYSQEQIDDYMSSYEYFVRTKEATTSSTSLTLTKPSPAHLLPGAAGLVLPRHNEGRVSSAAVHQQRPHVVPMGEIVEYAIVVVGAGVAAGHFVKEISSIKEISSQGTQMDVCLIGEDSLPPYDRALLMKHVLSAQTHWSTSDSVPLLINGANFFRDNKNCTHIAGATVVNIDTGLRVVTTSTGMQYKATAALVLAMGCRAKTLADANIPIHSVRGGGRGPVKSHWAKCGGLHYIGSYSDVEGILGQIRGGGLLANSRAVIIGADIKGLEAAAALLAQRVNNLTIVHGDECILPGVFEKKVSQFYESVYRTANCKIISGVSVVGVLCDDESGWINGINLSNGTFVPADLCVVALGVKPNTGLVQEQLDLSPDGGIVVDNRLCTSSDGVYAIGSAAMNKGECRFYNWAYSKETAIVAASSVSAASAAAIPSANNAPPRSLTLDYLPQWASNSTFLRFDWVAFGALRGTQTVEFGIDRVLAQQLQFENSILAPNQQRRRYVQGHAASLIEASSPVKDRQKVERRFGVWFIDETSHVVGGFLEGGTDAEKADMQRAVAARAQWPLPGWE